MTLAGCPVERISIHAPRTGSDKTTTNTMTTGYGFQSTLPVRGATRDTDSDESQIQRFQSTLPVRGATRDRFDYYWPVFAFQSTLPVRGATTSNITSRRPSSNFNPRSPYGERPGCPWRSPPHQDISIHAPRTGSDEAHSHQAPREKYFNPRSPYGERHRYLRGPIYNFLFQSTLPVRGATFVMVYSLIDYSLFQSTLPVRGATTRLLELSTFLQISIHAPRTGSDNLTSFDDAVLGISIHAPRTGSDT